MIGKPKENQNQKKDGSRHTKELFSTGVSFPTENLVVVVPVVIGMQIGLIDPLQRCF